jgi:hypothetical protein
LITQADLTLYDVAAFLKSQILMPPSSSPDAKIVPYYKLNKALIGLLCALGSFPSNNPLLITPILLSAEAV